MSKYISHLQKKDLAMVGDISHFARRVVASDNTQHNGAFSCVVLSWYGLVAWLIPKGWLFIVLRAGRQCNIATTVRTTTRAYLVFSLATRLQGDYTPFGLALCLVFASENAKGQKWLKSVTILYTTLHIRTNKINFCPFLEIIYFYYYNIMSLHYLMQDGIRRQCRETSLLLIMVWFIDQVFFKRHAIKYIWSKSSKGTLKEIIFPIETPINQWKCRKYGS